MRRNLDQGQYLANLKKNHQFILPELEMKPQDLWQGETLTGPHSLIGNTSHSTAWIEQNETQLRGHTLVWPGDPHILKWLLKQRSTITPDKAKELLNDSIHTVVRRYEKKIHRTIFIHFSSDLASAMRN